MSQSFNREDDGKRLSAGEARRLTDVRQTMMRMVMSGKSWSARERNVCFLNTGAERFANVSAVSGLDFREDGRAAAVVDWDADGDLDVWLSNRNAPRVRFLRNGASGGRFLSLRLVGNGTSVSRDAIGARVEVLTGDGSRRIETLRAGDAFLTQSSKWLHFGLGDLDEVEGVAVRWPDGETETFRGLDLDRRYVLEQGSGRAVGWHRPGEGVRELTPSVQEPLPLPDAARIPLVPLIALPRLDYEPFDGKERAIVRVGKGRPVWLNLWASWCAPCVAELGEMDERAADLAAAGVQVVALSVDGLGEDTSSKEAAERVARDLGLDHKTGRATIATLNALQTIHGWLVPTYEPLPLPTSFLIDGSGRISVIYKGRVSVDTVLADVAHSNGDRAERFESSAILPGAALRHPVIEDFHASAMGATRLNVADLLWSVGRQSDALVQYKDALALLDSLADDIRTEGVHGALGRSFLADGDLVGAERHLGLAVDRDPHSPEARYALGTALIEAGDYRAARLQLETAVALRPGFPEARHHLSLALELAGELERAVEQCRYLLQDAPDFPGVRERLQRLERRLRRRDKGR